MLWLPIALFCGLCLATADAVTKKKLSDYRATELTIIRFGFTGIVLSPLVVTFPFTAMPTAFWGWVLLLLPLEITANLLYMSAVRSAPLSITLPYQAFTPVFATLTAFFLLQESVSLIGFGGVFLVVVGAYCLNAGIDEEEDEKSRWLRPLRALAKTRGSQKMLGAAVLYAATSVIGKRVLEYVDGAHFAAFYYALLGVVALVLFTVTKQVKVKVLWRRPAWQVVVGALMAAMILAHFAAIEMAQVAYFLSVKRTSLLFGILYGAILFRERHIGRRLLAGTVMVSGVVLIALES